MKHKSIARLMIAGLILSAPLILPVTVAQPSSGNMSTPTTGGVNSVVLLPDREGDTGQITIFTSGGAIQLIQPLQEFSITNPLQPPAPPVRLNPQQVQQLYGSTISSQPLPPQPPTPMPTLSPTQSLTPTYDATVFYALYMTALAEGVQKQDAIATAQAGAQATTQAQATATAPTATMTFTPSPTVEDVGQLPPVSPLTQTAEAQAATAEALALTPSTTNTLTPSPTVDVSQLPVIPWITMPEVLPEPLPQVVPVDALPAQPPQEPPQQPLPADALPAEHLLTPTALLDTNRPEQIAVPQGAVDAPAEQNSSKPTQTPTFTPTVTFTPTITFTPSPRPTLTHTPIPSPTLPAAQRFATQQAVIDAAATLRADNWATQQIQLTTSPQPPQVLTELAVIMTQQAQMVIQQQARLNREVQFATAQAQTATAIALALTPPATSTLTPSPTVEDVVQLLPVPPLTQTAEAQAQIVAMLFQTAQARYQVATAQAQTAIPLTQTAIAEIQALPPTERAQVLQTMRAEWLTGMAQTATVVLQAATARVQTATAAAQTATAQPPVTQTAVAEMRMLEVTAQAQLQSIIKTEMVAGLMQTVTAQVQTAMAQVPLTQTASAESIALTRTAIAAAHAPTLTAIAEIQPLNANEQIQMQQTRQAERATEVALTRTIVAIEEATGQAEAAIAYATEIGPTLTQQALEQDQWAIQATQSAESMAMTAQARTTRWAATATEPAQIIGATRAASATSQAQRLATQQVYMLATVQAQLGIQNIDSQGAIEGLAQQNPLNTMLTPTIPAVSVDTVVQPQDLMNTGKTLLPPTATLPGNLFSNADLSNGSPLLQALATALSRGESVSNAISTAYAVPAPSATPTLPLAAPNASADQVASAIATPPTTDEQLRITPTPTATPLQTMPLSPADQLANALANGESVQQILASMGINSASPDGQALLEALAQGLSLEQALATAQALLTPTATQTVTAIANTGVPPAQSLQDELDPDLFPEQVLTVVAQTAQALLTPTATLPETESQEVPLTVPIAPADQNANAIALGTGATPTAVSEIPTPTATLPEQNSLAAQSQLPATPNSDAPTSENSTEPMVPELATATAQAQLTATAQAPATMAAKIIQDANALIVEIQSEISTRQVLASTPTPSPTPTETLTPTPSPTPTETPTPTPSRTPLPSLTPSPTPTSDRQPNACDPGGTLAGKCSIGDPGFICPPDVTDCAGYSQMLWQSGYYLQQYEDGNLTYDQIPDTLKWVAPQPTPSGMGFCSVVIPEDERINLELPDPTLLIPLEVIYGLSDPNATYGSVLPYGLDWESTAAYGPILTVYGQVNAFDIWLSTVGWIETLVSISCPNPTPPT